MATELKKNQLKRAVTLESATYLLTELKTLLEEVEINKPAITSTINACEDGQKEILELNKKILGAVSEEEKSSEARSALQQKLQMNTAILKAREAIVTTSRVQQPNNSESSLMVKLPKLNLPRFDGNILNWVAFWESFRSVHLNTGLSAIEKFSYLVGQLDDEPQRTIKGLSKTETNYTEAISMLTNAYGNKERIAAAHLHAMWDIVAPSNKLDSIKDFRTKIECSLRSLEAAGLSPKCDFCNFSTALYITRKLPNAFLEKIGQQEENNYFQLPNLRKAMEKEINKLEARITNVEKPLERVEREYNSPYSRRPTNYNERQGYEPTRVNSTVGAYQVNTKTYPCKLCGELHRVHACTKYKTIEEKTERVKDQELCPKCLRKGHTAMNCISEFGCYRCNGNDHHPAICTRGSSQAQWRRGNGEQPAKNISTSMTVTTAVTNISDTVALPTARIPLKVGNVMVRVRGLLDQGAQRSLVLNEFVKIHDIPVKEEVMLSIDGFGSRGKEKKYPLVDLHVQLENEMILIKAIVVETLPDRIEMPGIGRVASELTQQGVQLADQFDEVEKIQLIIGADSYYEFVVQPKLGNVNVIESKLGTMLTGPIEQEEVGGKVKESGKVSALEIGVVQLQRDIDTLWNLDILGIDSKEAHPDDERALREFNASIRYDEGRYTARLPWKDDQTILPTNWHLAQGRLRSSIKRMSKDPKLLEDYNSVIQEQLQCGFIEEVDLNEQPKGERLHYLSHHAVTKESDTTPMRVVFDCSAKPNQRAISLNDCLFSGPSMVPEMTQILMRFRTEKWAASADIRKAFLMINLDDRDRDVTRFLWPANPNDSNSPFKVYRFRVILFGATCSSFILNATICYHLSKCTDKERGIAKDIARNIYVDNVFCTHSKESETMNFYGKSKQLLATAGLELREWATNSKKLAQKVKMNGDEHAKQVVSVLGLQWNTENDVLSINPREVDAIQPTKRKVLQGLAMQFDPLGFMAPVTIKAKLLMQDLWKKNFEWDQRLPTEYAEQWKKLAQEMALMCEVPVKRHGLNREPTELHAFADASGKAYGAVVYGVQGNKVTLLIAKARVAPLKELTIPKLELTALVLAARLLNYVQETHQDDLVLTGSHLWSDSQVALGWVRSQNPLPTYMQNRTDELRIRVPEAKWHYIETKRNPADLVSRGTSVKILKTSNLWWHGPEGLCDGPHEEVPLQKRGENAQVTVVAASQPTRQSVGDKILERSSTFVRAVRITGWMKRFAKTMRTKLTSRQGRQTKPREMEKLEELTSEELEEAETWLTQSCQQEIFETEYKFLKKPNEGAYPPLIKQLHLQLHKNVIICRSRLEETTFEEQVVNPTLLPTHHLLTKLIIEHVHRSHNHSGVNATLSHLRQRWWIPRARQRVKHILKRCVLCKRVMGTAFAMPPAPPLPKMRVGQGRPFAVTGVDYGGPLITKTEGKREKRYIALFTCASSRAVHLEVAIDLSTETFLRTYQRFVSRRSIPRVMISDNGSNFVGAASILEKWQEDARIQQELATTKTTWKFIPSRAPWFGGFWERMIGMTKQALNKTLGRTLVTDDELHTVMCRIEATLNDRPVTYVTDQLNEPQPLTPSMLMQGYRLDSIPMPVIDPEEEADPTINPRGDMTERQRHCELVLAHFWKRWEREYLTNLKRLPWHRDVRTPPAVGDVVLVHDEGTRMTWNLGKITEVHVGIDGAIRSAKLRTSHGVIIRPIVKLYPMEVRAENYSPQNATERSTEKTRDDNEETCNEEIKGRVPRKAAVAARQRFLD